MTSSGDTIPPRAVCNAFVPTAQAPERHAGRQTLACVLHRNLSVR